jgi:putative transposase
MRKSKFSESQSVGILKDAESGVSDVKRLSELETENVKLKRMYAGLALENAAIKDVLNRKL